MKKIYYGYLMAAIAFSMQSCKKIETQSNPDQHKSEHISSEEKIKTSGLYFWGREGKIPLTLDSTTAIFLPEDSSFAVSNLTGKFVRSEFRKLRSDYLLIKGTNKIDLKSISKVARNIQYAFKLPKGGRLIPTGEINLQPKPRVDIKEVLSLTKASFKIKRKSKYNTYTIKIENNSSLLDIANSLHESGLVEYAIPNFIINAVPASSDPLYNNQYYLNNTGQFWGTPGIDVNINNWQTTDGFHCGIKVAVVDDGVEAHEDFAGRLLNGFTPLNPVGNGAPLASGNTHGQACAGIIAASKDNAIGIAGIAPKVSIIPVNIMIPYQTSADVEASIDWAWDDAGADVLSNSIQYTLEGTYHIDIEQAITRARTLGRGGKGSVVVFASGNQSTYITFPGNVPGVITVGAVDRNGIIQAYSGKGSAHLDLVAPAGQLNNGDIQTTDRMGINGIVSGNYFDTFGGTSAACPQVAGAAALILSINPNLTEIQVASILTSTATDMGTAGYDMVHGYGRLNVDSAATKAANEAYPITGGSTICYPAQQYYSVNLPAGATVSWQTGVGLSIIGSSTSSTVKIKRNSFNNNGATSLTATITLPGCGSVKTTTRLNSSSPCPLPTAPILPGVHYFGRVSTPTRIYFFYGNSATQVITAGVIMDMNKQFTVTHFIGAKVTVNGLTGRMYATDEDGFQYTFVLSNMDLELEILE